MTENKYAVEVADLDADGPELSDEELRATRGGLIILISWESSCVVGGGTDFDNPHPL
jgi:hypothetical protein